MSGLIGQLAGENGVSNGHGSARPIMFGSGSYVLIGRRSERALLDRLVEAVRRGESRALVVHGEPGVGKTALLDYLARQASGCRVARIAGIQSEMELAFAGLHQLCGPMLDHLERLPAPQRDALQTILGLATGSPPDRLLVGLAVLSLLSEVAEGQPLICLVDDQQWLDHASAQALAFAARRLVAESVGLVFACRPLSSELAGVPELLVEGLGEADARALLDSALAAPLDGRVRDQIVAETGGNPLALLELPRSATPSQLAGGFGLPVAAPLAGSIEESFCRRLGALADDTRRLLLLAAAEPIGDPAPIWRAAACLGIPAGAAEGAVDAGLAEFGARVRFSHPLVRSAVYRSASALDKHQVHRALADATDADVDPDRRAWHLAQATTGPDEEVAAELERSAGRAQARGGISAGAAFLERAATLTLDPRLRVGRATSAAQAKIQTGAFDAAVDLLAIAEAGPLSHLQRAGLDLARAQLAYATNRGSDAAPLLKRAASGLEPIDVALSRSTYLDALTAAIFAGRLARSGGDVLVVAQAAGAAPAPITAPRAPDFLLDGLAMTYNEGFAAGLPKLRQALAAFAAAMSAEEVLRWSFIACVAAMRTWSDESWESLSARHLQVAREAGALSELPLALISRAHMVLFAGDLGVAASLTDETLALEEATGSKLAPYSALAVAAWRGEEARARALIEATKDDVNRRGEGVGITLAEWANAVLNNGLGRYDDALIAAQNATAFEPDPGSAIWPAVELIEAAARSGATETAHNAYRSLAAMTSASATAWALGVEARSKALLSEDEGAEGLYRESITRLGRTRLRIDLARAHLLYGEWLRRHRRRIDARERLRTAYRMFEEMGVNAFAERARRELKASGDSAIKRASAQRHLELTAQEAQIARLARDGLSNPEIGTRLFISAHTVQYHLRKVFHKLGISSRSQLETVLPRGEADAERRG